ncbi:MAG: hypothetical protein P8Y96_12815 [Desulfuromonadales bacterium]
MTLLIENTATFHGQPLGVDPLIEHELQGIEIDHGQISRLTELEREGTLVPTEKTVDDLFHLRAHRGLESLAIHTEFVHQNIADPATVVVLLLEAQGLLERRHIGDAGTQNKIAEIFRKGRGGRPDDLTVMEDQSAFAITAGKFQHAGFTTQTDDLQNFSETEVFKVADQTHGIPRKSSRNYRGENP